MATPERVAWMGDILNETWPREQASDRLLEIYLAVLRDVSDEELRLATYKLVSEATFRPKPAEVRTAALELRQLPRMTAGEAWGLWCEWRDLPPTKWVGEKHLRRNPLPPEVAAVVRGMGGAEYLAQSPNEMSDRSQFVKEWEKQEVRFAKGSRMLPEVREAMLRLQAPEMAQVEAGG